MKKNIVAFFLVFVMGVSSLVYGESVYASTTLSMNRDNSEVDMIDMTGDIIELKSILCKIENYIDVKGTKLFNVKQAKLNNESSEIIKIGLAYNELFQAEQRGEHSKVNRRKRAILDGLVGYTYYGNWCGKGNKGAAPIDILDEQCKKHDLCYDAKGMWNTECDIQFIHNIAKNFGAINKLGGHSRAYAIAAILLFSGKVGGIDILKDQYPMLRPFLP